MSIFVLSLKYFLTVKLVPPFLTLFFTSQTSSSSSYLIFLLLRNPKLRSNNGLRFEESTKSVFVTLMLISLSSTPTSSISVSIQFPDHKSPTKTIDSLLADAHFIDNIATVQLNNPTPSSFGIILPNTPFNFTSSTSLSSHFTFQIGNGVALVIIPANFPSKFARNMSFELLNANRFLGIEFYANLCKASSSRVSNVSEISNVLMGGVKLSSWVDYRAISKRIDVRVSKFGDSKPVEPLISHHMDLGEVLRGEEVLLGLAALNGKDERVTVVYSWSLEVEDVPKWVHSIPVNPEEYASVESDKKEGGFVSGFVFAAGCGALAALVMFFVWSYVVDRREVQAEDSVRAGDFRYAKIDVLEGTNLAVRNYFNERTKMSLP